MNETVSEQVQPRIETLPGDPGIKAIKWRDLVFELSLEEVMILKLLYTPGPKSLVFVELERRLRKLNRSEKTIRNKIKKLERKGLLETVNSYGLFIYSVPDLEQQVYELIRQCSQRFTI